MLDLDHQELDHQPYRHYILHIISYLMHIVLTDFLKIFGIVHDDTHVSTETQRPELLPSDQFEMIQNQL